MFQSLKDTVASAISSDPLYAYAFETAERTLCGRGFLFEKRDATVRANGKRVSIFTLHTKRLLERCTPDEALAMMRTVKDGVAMLTHLRHPGVLSIEGPLVEEKKKVWFVSERVTAVLTPEAVEGVPLQVRLMGLCHCAEGIRFLHEKAELLLMNFALSSIYVTESKQWKVGDLCFALPRSQVSGMVPPPVPFSSVAAPLLDYLPVEYVEFCTRRRGGATDNLFNGGTAAPLVFPDSDTYAFLVVTCEVIDERRLFNCAGNAAELPRQMSAAESRMAKYFPTGALRLPRPPIATVINTGPFATPDMKTLVGLATFDTLDSDARFRLLKGLYDGLAQNFFCESVLLTEVVPLMVRESRVDAMLRFVLPILLLCANSLSQDNFRRALRDYFVSFLTAVIRAPSLENIAIYVEQILQKREGLDKHLASVEDRATYIVPLLLKLLQSDGHERIQLGTLEWLRDVLLQTPTVKLGLPNDIAARLMNVAAAYPAAFTLAFQCLEQLLTFSTTETKMEVEASLTRSLTATAATASFSAAQMDCVLRVLRSVEEQMSREHRALKSIPLLCPLLLHSNPVVKDFAVASVVSYAQMFSSGGPSSSSPATAGAALPPASSVFALSSPYAAGSSAPVGPPVRASTTAAAGFGGAGSRGGAATGATANGKEDLFASLFA